MDFNLVEPSGDPDPIDHLYNVEFSSSSSAEGS